MTLWRKTFSSMLMLLLASMNAHGDTFDSRGIQFIPFKSFGSFTRLRGSNAAAGILTSPAIPTRICCDQLIVSWNAELPSGTRLQVDARAFYPDHATKWFHLGLWSADPSKHPRTSVKGQQDSDGDVDTDTLVLKQGAALFQVRVTLLGEGRKKPKLKFLSLSLLDSQAVPAALPPKRAAWGKLIDVPERSQMAYENGDKICSPTTISMLLAHWSQQLGRPGLDCDVPEVVTGVNDPAWGGTGNWVFNTAYAGSFRRLRAYTTRLSDVSELEALIERGIPVGLSLCYNRLRGKSREPSGHLVVCVGFTKNGDPIINDPGTSKQVRKTFPRANLVDAWAYSKNAVYLVYPVNTRLPEDRFGHWESPKSSAGANKR
jgi:Peptidase_C39 like family